MHTESDLVHFRGNPRLLVSDQVHEEADLDVHSKRASAGVFTGPQPRSSHDFEHRFVSELFIQLQD